ncbi:MAG: PEP/pyruvate-binding domain-containing protein [Candidatus Aminicenantes bacterium]|nr:PEP/pyruvate-binding domain-containing protein [Candidatus Aminicenantes bacterium]
MSQQDPSKTADELFCTLHERSKELSCLYTIEEILSNFSLSLEEVFHRVIAAIPPGWQFPKICQVRIVYGSELYDSPDFVETPFVQNADIRVQDAVVGRLLVCYTEPTPEADCGPFLQGEVKLIQTIAERLGHFILHQRLRLMFEEMSGERREEAAAKKSWRIALDLLSNTDQSLFLRISRKMMNYLGWRGVSEARSLLLRHGENQDREELFGEANWPQEKTSLDRLYKLSEETFKIAAANLTDEEILGRVQKWINEDRSSDAVKVLENIYSSLNEVLDSMRRLKLLLPQGAQLSRAKADSVRVALIRRFFTDQLEYINILKKYVDLEDFFDMMGRIIFPPDSRGKLGGKSAGLFLGSRVLSQAARRAKALGTVKKPKTWYITSDGVINFLQYNNLEDVIEQKYKDIDEVRLEYPHLVQVFKNCSFPSEIVKGLSVALDDFGETPIIVRSSSLLEDRMGTAFAGKYKSLFLANQGDKKKRLDALLDAVAEVYASTFNPDAIQYRAERGLLDFHEEMGIMIQAVVGRKVGRYFFPAFAGVAFSRNEFRWSARIRREDGLLRLVPGLGTRAVDRLSDDYPVLVAPAQPSLRVNVSQEEMVRYSPRKIDVIDLENNCFTTKDIRELLREIGPEYPSLDKILSLYRDGLLKPPLGLVTDFVKEDLVVTFDGLIHSGGFMPQLVAILKTLESALGVPVDVEFAFDGQDFYLLQCRPQSQSAEEAAMEIPADLPSDSVLFTANRFVSNGRVADITHIVYIDPDRYGEIAALSDLAAVGLIVGKLNTILPRRRFILMGPGRWGSRGDIKLGVRVTYSDISNAAMLIEVARKKGHYVPDVSFGTHFFQDLVESGIRYLPLYPDDPQVQFNDQFLKSAPNILLQILPAHKKLADAVRLIDVARTTGGKTLQVLMNADREKAIAYFAGPGSTHRPAGAAGLAAGRDPNEHSRWRRRMAEQIARLCDAPRRGVAAVYLLEDAIGGLDGPDAEISLLIHFEGTAEQKKELQAWLEGWNAALTETNLFRTGLRLERLLVCRFVGREAADKKSAAAALGLPEEALFELPIVTKAPRGRKRVKSPPNS